MPSTGCRLPVVHRLYPSTCALGARALHKAATPSDKDAERRLAAMSASADTLIARGELEEASQLLTIVLAGLRSLKGDGHADTVGSMGTLSQTLSALGQHAAAATLAQEAAGNARESLGARHEDTRLALSNLAQVLARSGELNEAGVVLFEAQAAMLAEAAEAEGDAVSIELQVVTSNLAQARLLPVRMLTAAVADDTTLSVAHAAMLNVAAADPPVTARGGGAIWAGSAAPEHKPAGQPPWQHTRRDAESSLTSWRPRQSRRGEALPPPPRNKTARPNACLSLYCA